MSAIRLFTAICVLCLSSLTAISATPAQGAAGSVREIRPVSIWLTPGATAQGKNEKHAKIYEGSIGVQAAHRNGVVAEYNYAQGEEFLCVFCDHYPLQYSTHALLIGYRVPLPFGYLSAEAGPNWGEGQRSVPGAEAVPDPDCGTGGSMFCTSTTPKEELGGFGGQFQLQAALTGRFVGIGAEFHLRRFDGFTIGGVSLILPFGLIR